MTYYKATRVDGTSFANLADANLTDANLTGARGDKWTTLPSGYEVNDAGLIVRVSVGEQPK